MTANIQNAIRLLKQEVRDFDILGIFLTPAAPATAPGAFTLVVWKRNNADGPNDSKPIEWATHWLNCQVGGLSMGHYFQNEVEARADFAKRVGNSMKT